MKRFFTRKKVIVFVVVAALAAIIFWLVNKGSKAPEVTANVSKLERKTLEHVISVKAPLVGIEKAEVTSPLNYKINDIRVKEGDLVKKDDILAVLDSEDLEKEIEYEENQIELSKMEAEEKGFDILIAHKPMDKVGRAKEKGETKSFLSLRKIN